MNVVKQTGHSSFYVEKGMSALGKTAKQMGMQNESRVSGGGALICLSSVSNGLLNTSLSVPNLARGSTRALPRCCLSNPSTECSLLSYRRYRMLLWVKQ